MKNKFLIAMIFSAFLLIAPNVQAANFTDNQTVDANKTWKIKFTSDVGLDDVTKQGITVTTSTGAAISVGIQLEQDSKTVTVTAPEGGYIPGESYVLNVGAKAHSNKGKALKKEYTVNFTIKSNTNNSSIVTFKDKNLEQVIRERINKTTGDIYKSDVEKITILKNINYYNIQDISGIENLTNLKTLNLYDIQISDISALKGLTNLQDVDLAGNQISDISALKELTNLQKLVLVGFPVSNISALNGLTNLQELDLEGLPVSDISGLNRLSKLQTLSLRFNQISDISALNGLLNLQTLNLYHNQIRYVNGLKGLPSLQMLDLSDNQISDINLLNGLPNLQKLVLGGNQISDISGLKGLPNLQELYLYGNQIDHVAPLAKLTNLKNLDLSYNSVCDASLQSLKDALPDCNIRCDISHTAYKPNIYLYPEKTEELSVYVNPIGKITKSIPDYNQGWKVTVDPSGKIDNKYDFLFYEASLNYQFTLDKGWIVNKDNFNEEMNNILTSIGLSSKEKADFIEYWSQRLNGQNSRYAAYYLDPKEINEAIKLNISKEPDSILRVFFYFVPLNDNENLEIKKPEIKEFKRNGFTVVEWGVIGK